MEATAANGQSGNACDAFFTGEMIALVEVKKWFELGEMLCTSFASESLSGSKVGKANALVERYGQSLDMLHLTDVLLYAADEIEDPAAAIAFIEEKKGLEYMKREQSAVDLLDLRIVVLLGKKGDKEGAVASLAKIEANITNVTPLNVRSMFHLTQAQLDKIRHDYDGFYEHAFLALSTGVMRIDATLAFDLCVASLLASGIASFGELASHPILESLTGTENEWMRNFIVMLDNGAPECIDAYEQTYATHIAKSPVLGQFSDMIKRKVSMAVFFEFIFQQPFDTRVFSFDSVAKKCQMSKHEVELLIIRAFSAGLIKGSLDQVEEKVAVTWCKPKTLGNEKLVHLQAQLDRWIEFVHRQRVALAQRSDTVVG